MVLALNVARPTPRCSSRLSTDFFLFTHNLETPRDAGYIIFVHTFLLLNQFICSLFSLLWIFVNLKMEVSMLCLLEINFMYN
jgi:hypothetical protein